MKLLSLFLIAAVHYAYMTSFLEAFAAIADYADSVGMKATMEEALPLRHQVEVLADVSGHHCFIFAYALEAK